MRIGRSRSSAWGPLRWYVWQRTGGGWRKQRLRSYVLGLCRLNQHVQAAAVLAEAAAKGYRFGGAE